MNRTPYDLLALSLAFVLLSPSPPIRAQTLQPLANPPRMGTFYSMTFTTNWPPLPCLPFDVPVYLLYTDPAIGPVYLYDDTGVDYDALKAMTTIGPLDANPETASPLYGPGDLYLSIEFDTNRFDEVDVVLHNPQPTPYYQVLTNTALTKPLSWGFGPIWQSDPSTNAYWFHTSYIDPADQFFRAVSGVAIVSVDLGFYPVPIIGEPPAVPNTSFFAIHVRQDNPTGLNVVYTLTGSAVNGVDYTNLPTQVYIPAGARDTNIYIQAISDNITEFAEKATLTLVLTNGYVVNPEFYQATVTITDNIPNLIQAVLTNLPVADFDWHSNTHSLIVSAYAPYWDGGTNYFARISTSVVTNNGTLVTNVAITNWSNAGGSYDEVRLTVVKTNTGFHFGDTFFGPEQPGTIGWISSDGLTFSNQWLTIGAESNAFRGDIYVDQTGIWGGDLLVVTGEGRRLYNQPMNIWRISTNKQASLVASILTEHLEGIVTLPNDPAKYGPWAAKLITADEGRSVFYSVGTDGTVTPWHLDVLGDPIQASGMKVIPANQNLYFSDPRTLALPPLPPLVLKIDQSYFTNYVGDILVTRAGESGRPAALFIVHWDSTSQTFVNSEIYYGNQGDPFYGEFIEHCTFAPIDLPAIPPQ